MNTDKKNNGKTPGHTVIVKGEDELLEREREVQENITTPVELTIKATDGQGPVAHGKPFTDGFHAASETARLEHAQQKPETGELSHRAGKDVKHVGHRPARHKKDEPAARADVVNDATADGIHHAVAGEKPGVDLAVTGVVEVELGLDRADKHRERLAVEIIQRRSKTKEPGDIPAESFELHHSG